MRADDYSIIGAALGMLLSPAIFLKRANIVTLVAGGAAIGLGGGIWAHLAKSFTKGEDVKPEAMVSVRCWHVVFVLGCEDHLGPQIERVGRWRQVANGGRMRK